MKKISEQEARRLLENDDYVSDLDLSEESFSEAMKVLESSEDWPRQDVREEHKKQFDDFYSDFRDAVISHILSQDDSSLIDVRYDSPFSAMQVKAHAVYKVGPTIRGAIGNILVIIRMIGMTTVTFSIEAAIVGQQVSEVIKKIIDGYVSIDDPAERKVFEAILKLRAELVVINYDALHGKDFKNAYGKIDPSKERIVERLADDLSQTEAEAAIKGLVDKGVIKKSGNGYRMVF